MLQKHSQAVNKINGVPQLDINSLLSSQLNWDSIGNGEYGIRYPITVRYSNVNSGEWDRGCVCVALQRERHS